MAQAESILEQHRFYSAKAKFWSRTSWLVAILPLVVAGLMMMSREDHALRWPRLILCWTPLLALLTPLQPTRRALCYRRASDVLTGAAIRLEVNPEQSDVFFAEVQRRVENSLRPLQGSRQSSLAT